MIYKTQATLEQILAYRPDDVATHTPSPLVNAVADTLFTTKSIECVQIAREMRVEVTMLSAAVRLETGMYLKDILHAYRLAQFNAFKAAHPNYSANEIAQELGYENAKSISRFVRSQTGQTVRGKQSIAPKRDAYVKLRTVLRKKLRGEFVPDDEQD